MTKAHLWTSMSSYVLVFCSANNFFVNFSRSEKSGEASMLNMHSMHVDWLDTHSLLAIKLCPIMSIHSIVSEHVLYACSMHACLCGAHSVAMTCT